MREEPVEGLTVRIITAFVALLVVVLLVGLLRVESGQKFKPLAAQPKVVSASTAQGQNGKQGESAEPKATAAVHVLTSTDQRYPSWRLETDWKESENRALDEAVAEARVDLIDYLRTQDPPLEWIPSDTYVRALLRKSTKVEPKQFKSEDGEPRLKYRCVGTFEVTSAMRHELLHKDRELRAQQRMWLLARVLGAALIMLAAVTGYLRMDEATKGYYTGWLRLAALGFVGGGALVLFLIAG